ncbi:PIN domain-containing protein [Geodermatophilus sp. TF02-6]|uniref:PIN domain-containing protein n=1 Tax=Geodermatophilus sp. TF02-6 TaxID=2250575 RepID=UPI001313EDC7|nr:PIN domain-containing protein [Geodermatophilus sp. TF02-6]
MTYLFDKSAWVLGGRNRVVADRLAGEIRARNLGLCTVTALELLYSARNAQEYDATLEHLRRLPWYDLSDQRAAIDVQRRLALRGQHRTSLPDVIVAATAAEHRLTVLHYDSDYERLAEVTGITHEWVAPRGEGHDPGS